MGIIPNKYVLSTFEAANEVSGYLNNKDRCLIIGGRSIDRLLGKSCQYYEPRKRFQVESVQLNNFEDYDCIIVFSDLISELDELPEALLNINQRIRDDQKFYLIDYNFQNNYLKYNFRVDGFLHKGNQLINWFDLNRSHMHLGYKKNVCRTITIKDLSYDYKIIE